MARIVKPLSEPGEQSVKTDKSERIDAGEPCVFAGAAIQESAIEPEGMPRERGGDCGGLVAQSTAASSVSEQPDGLRIVADTDADLLFHAKKEAPDWSHEVAKIGDDYELMKDIMALPVECALKRERCEFAYRWLNIKNKDTFTAQTTGPIRWFVVNRMNAPYIKSVPFDDPGVIRKGDMVLAKMPWEMYMRRNQIYHSAAILPKKEGKRDEEGRYEYTGVEGGKLRSGDMVMAEEKSDQKGTRIESYGKHGVRWSGDPDQG